MVQINQGEERTVQCPRCTETCGWCGDYRFMHGQLRLPGSRLYCTISDMNPDADCPVCHGAKSVIAHTTYSPSPKPQEER